MIEIGLQASSIEQVAEARARVAGFGIHCPSINDYLLPTTNPAIVNYRPLWRTSGC